MLKHDIEIINKLGLHARASAKLTQTAAQYQSDVFIAKGARRVNAKSIMGVMMLAAGKGTTVAIDVSGVDEVDALAAVVALFNDKFGEGE